MFEPSCAAKGQTERPRFRGTGDAKRRWRQRCNDCEERRSNQGSCPRQVHSAFRHAAWARGFDLALLLVLGVAATARANPGRVSRT